MQAERAVGETDQGLSAGEPVAAKGGPEFGGDRLDGATIGREMKVDVMELLHRDSEASCVGTCQVG